MRKKILIGWEDFAGYLGIGLHKLLRHRQALRHAGVIERHGYQGRLYTVCCPDRLNDYWRARRFD